MKTPTLLALPALFWLSSAATLNDLFVVKTAGNGLCTTAQQTAISSWLVDTETLVDALLKAIPKYDTDESLRLNMAAFFSIGITKAGSMNKGDIGKANTIKRK